MSEHKQIDRPVPGTYRVRMRKGAPWIPARIVARVATDPVTGEKLDRSPTLVLFVAGEEADMLRWWPSLHPIERDEYDRLVAAMPDDVAQRVDFLADEVPFAGHGHNSRDAALAISAALVLNSSISKNGEDTASRVVTLVKQIIAWRDHEAEALAIASEPLKKALAELKREHFCDAETYRPRLLAWLAEWAKAHGQPPKANGCTAHWTTVTRLVCDAEYETPRSYLEPDRKRIEAALKAGADVPGWRLETKQEMRVV